MANRPERCYNHIGWCDCLRTPQAVTFGPSSVGAGDGLFFYNFRDVRKMVLMTA
nr:MAG TPA: hypothetical protein [Caudoviricetes sp.]